MCRPPRTQFPDLVVVIVALVFSIGSAVFELWQMVSLILHR